MLTIVRKLFLSENSRLTLILIKKWIPQAPQAMNTKSRHTSKRKQIWKS